MVILFRLYAIPPIEQLLTDRQTNGIAGLCSRYLGAANCDKNKKIMMYTRGIYILFISSFQKNHNNQLSIHTYIRTMLPFKISFTRNGSNVFFCDNNNYLGDFVHFRGGDISIFNKFNKSF